MGRITLTLETREKDALIELAIIECRDPRYQAALIIREELIRRGLLTQETQIDLDPNWSKALGKVLENG